MRDGHIAALEARLSAQRRVLAWLVSELTSEQGARLIAAVAEPYPPQDGQEDPGAVPVVEFAGIAAFSAELRVILSAVTDQQAPAQD